MLDRNFQWSLLLLSDHECFALWPLFLYGTYTVYSYIKSFCPVCVVCGLYTAPYLPTWRCKGYKSGSTWPVSDRRNLQWKPSGPRRRVVGVQTLRMSWTAATSNGATKGFPRTTRRRWAGRGRPSGRNNSSFSNTTSKTRPSDFCAVSPARTLSPGG